MTCPICQIFHNGERIKRILFWWKFENDCLLFYQIYYYKLLNLSPLYFYFFIFAGPEKWADLFPQAKGHRQSPIDISTKNTTKGSDLKTKPLSWKYVPENTRSLVNPGYCWRVDVNGKGSELTGGPLGEDKYILEQFHCHWGGSDSEGSEHTVDGQSFAGELHLVHWNETKYPSFAEAARQPDGLAVLGVFLKVRKGHICYDIVYSMCKCKFSISKHFVGWLFWRIRLSTAWTTLMGCFIGKYQPPINMH